MRESNRWGTLVESLRSLLTTSVALIQTRVELFGIELEQELWRFRSLLVWGFAALLLALLAIGFLGVALIVGFWDTHRVLVSALVAGGFIVMTLVAVGLLVRATKARPQLFEGTLQALERDLETLRRER
jgi:uncharacterized membrane protein YqjE